MQTRSQKKNLFKAEVLSVPMVLPKVLFESNVLLKLESNVLLKPETIVLPKVLTKKPLYDVDIDFDEASEAWRANKKSIGNGQYKYVCSKMVNDKRCGCNIIANKEMCRKHSKILNDSSFE